MTNYAVQRRAFQRLVIPSPVVPCFICRILFGWEGHGCRHLVTTLLQETT